MSITVAVNGARGKMGQEACAALKKDARFTLMGELGREDSLSAFLQTKKPQVLVDLTRADVVYENARTIIEHGVHPVIGTSGLNDKQIDELIAQCQQMKLGALIVPNFSIGVLLMIHFAKQAARFFNSVEIVEAHHPQKFDSPSATAIKTAKEIGSLAQGLNPLTKQVEGHARGEWVKDIPIHSLRLDGVLAKQSVHFGGSGESLTISHESISRSCFMPGLLLACEKVIGLDSLKYGLEQVIDLRL